VVPKTFVVHKKAISHYSLFFKAAFESSMTERQTQAMRLEDVDSDVFGLLINWIYTQRVEHEDMKKYVS
jgi:hypothetical protein